MAFVLDLHWGYRKNSAALSAMKLIMLKLQRSKQLLCQAEFSDYFPDHAFPKSQYQKGIWLHLGTLGSHCTLRIHFADDPEHCNWNEVCLRVTNPLLSKKTFPNFHGRCATAICFHNLWKDCLQLLALCPCWAYFPWKFNISEWNLAVYWNVSV